MLYGAASGQSSLWTVLIIAVVVLVRLWRSRGTRPVNPVVLVIMTLLIVYATYELVAFSGALTGGSAPAGARTGSIRSHVNQAALPYYALGAILGLILGVVRGRTISIFWDATTRQVMQKGNAISLLIWVALFALRFGIEYLASKGLVGSLAVPIGDALLLIGTGSIIGRNLYMLLRYVQLSGGGSTTVPSR
jgi:hypothetical protein